MSTTQLLATSQTEPAPNGVAGALPAFGAIPFGLSFVLLWLSPNFSQTGLIIYYSVAYIIYEAMATIVYMPYYALTPELTEDYDERTKLTSYRMLSTSSAA